MFLFPADKWCWGCYCHLFPIAMVLSLTMVFMLNFYVYHQSCNSNWHMIWFFCCINQFCISVVPVTGATHATRKRWSPSLFSLVSLSFVTWARFLANLIFLRYLQFSSVDILYWQNFYFIVTGKSLNESVKISVFPFCWTLLCWLFWALFLPLQAPTWFAEIMHVKLQAKLAR